MNIYLQLSWNILQSNVICSPFNIRFDFLRELSSKNRVQWVSFFFFFALTCNSNCHYNRIVNILSIGKGTNYSQLEISIFGDEKYTKYVPEWLWQQSFPYCFIKKNTTTWWTLKVANSVTLNKKYINTYFWFNSCKRIELKRTFFTFPIQQRIQTKRA